MNWYQRQHRTRRRLHRRRQDGRNDFIMFRSIVIVCSFAFFPVLSYSWYSITTSPLKRRYSHVELLPFINNPKIQLKQKNIRSSCVCLYQQSKDNENDEVGENSLHDDDIEAKKECSQQDLTDRFKYKVNALMGAFDPIDASTDTESTQGNIFNALLKFPMEHTFHVIGKTNGDDTIQSQFVQQVKDTIVQSSYTPILLNDNDVNDASDTDGIKYEITSRGTKFTKVTIQKEVINAEEITFIYNQLSKLEMSVMQF